MSAAQHTPAAVLRRWGTYGDLRYRPQRDTRRPCEECGWSEYMAIHQPIISGPRQGEPYGHAYRPYNPSAAATVQGDGA